MWVRLTGTSGKCRFVNMDQIVMVGANEQNETEIYDAAQECITVVQESPEQIMALMGEGDTERVIDEVGRPLMREIMRAGEKWVSCDCSQQVEAPIADEPEHKLPCPKCYSLDTSACSADYDPIIRLEPYQWTVTFKCHDCGYLWTISCADVKFVQTGVCDNDKKNSPKYRWDNPPNTSMYVEFEAGVCGYASGFDSEWDWQLYVLQEYSTGGKSMSLKDAQVACEKAYEEYNEQAMPENKPPTLDIAENDKCFREVQTGATEVMLSAFGIPKELLDDPVVLPQDKHPTLLDLMKEKMYLSLADYDGACPCSSLSMQGINIETYCWRSSYSEDGNCSIYVWADDGIRPKILLSELACGVVKQMLVVWPRTEWVYHYEQPGDDDCV